MSEVLPQNKDLLLKINEIFYSIQGESTCMGRPCVFVRLSSCDLRCTYCDTTYAFYEGRERTLKDIMDTVAGYGCQLVEITGGEPLLQKNVLPLMQNLCDGGYEVLLETAGHRDIGLVDQRVKRIMDIKCPSSGESAKTNWNNIGHLRAGDEVKFVIGDRRDYEWARNVIGRYALTTRCTILFSPVFAVLSNKDLASWILEDRLPVRMQLQLHKYIWDPDTRGV